MYSLLVIVRNVQDVTHTEGYGALYVRYVCVIYKGDNHVHEEI